MNSINRSIAGWVSLLSGQYLSLMLGYKYEGLLLMGMALGFFGTNLVVSYIKLKKRKNEKN